MKRFQCPDCKYITAELPQCRVLVQCECGYVMTERDTCDLPAENKKHSPTIIFKGSFPGKDIKEGKNG